MMTANEIRDSYLKFFESKGHVIVPSAPMVIKDDPTLMFTNAGMNRWNRFFIWFFNITRWLYSTGTTASTCRAIFFGISYPCC